MSAFRSCLAAALLVVAIVPSASAASPFSSLVVFGDSLSDPGNAAALTGNAFPPYPGGHFSNGPTVAEYLAANLGAVADNFAIGGAMTGNGNYNYLADSPAGLQAAFPVLANTGMAQQIASYNPAVLDPAHTLFMLWGGPNDVFLGLATNPGGMSAVIDAATTNIANDVATLVVMGARNFLVPNMPDLGRTPEAVGTPSQADLTSISVGFNALLAGKLSFLSGALPSDAHLYTFSIFDALNNVIDGAPANGFTDVTTSCLSGGLPALATNCAGYLFFDGVHPTTATHALLAQQLAAAVPEPETYALMLFGLAVVGALARRSRLS